MDAGAGDDGVWTQGGDDTALGGAGADFLAGEGGNDTLSGGTGYDVLAGDDHLLGGREGDIFFGQAGADIFVLVGGTSWVMDLEAADTLVLPGVDSDKDLRVAASQVGDHVRVDFDGGELYLVWTTVEDLNDWSFV